MSIAAKLRLKNELPVLVLNLPPSCAGVFDGFEVKKSLVGKGLFMQVVLFAKDKKMLDEGVEKLQSRLQEDALFWVAYPKKSGSITSDLTRDEGWAVMNKYQYEGVTQIAIDADWSALRFRKTAAIGAKLRDIPMNERKTDCIDYVKRIVVLPADAIAAMKPYKGLADFFNAMSFSHKKEYVEAIADAKKPETRQRRIDKMIEALLKMKTVKAAKK
ncbi:hypothetical protein CAP35_00780 [Chitinophagaceae bacterium IBVUCB1]|nr:hypothetical protein CAP35_00780 [Chitinophagaceae bacterium IBVUCB1]